MGEYFRPDNLSDLLALLPSRHLTVLAGGTDYYPAKVGQKLDDDILDISAISELHGIERNEQRWVIGAATCWTDIVNAELPPLFDGLKLAAKEVGGRQIQNSGTIGGNLCNASPAADGVPALLSLDATVEVLSPEGSRMLSISEFVLGNRKTALQPTEILKAIHIPVRQAANSLGSFLKLGSRKYLVISLAMVAGTVEWDASGTITYCRLSVGACSEVAIRLTELEDSLVGQQMNSTLTRNIRDAHFSSLNPIDDVRATAVYRKDAAKTLIHRMISSWGAAS
ncbi:FAD binding domain-containing protein [Sneathiella sp.]|uniref:FAD binding domain-containing protein n=1 Tax=Sneathiella sp. TaxID=1964365 RepID=UPI0039E70150